MLKIMFIDFIRESHVICKVHYKSSFFKIQMIDFENRLMNVE